MRVRPLTSFTALRLWSVALALLAGASPGFAAECESRLSQSEVDYGRLHRGELPDMPSGQYWLALDTHRLTLTVVCQTPAPMKLRFNAASVGSGVFRMGNGGQFTVHINDAVIDGRAAMLVRDGQPELRPEQSFDAGQSIQAQLPGGEMTARHFTAQIAVQAWLDMRQLQVRDETVVDGAGTFELLTD
ncbi:hypothetical protein PSH79_26810 [Pseudomonas sp. FP2196]|uniref:hypothetical protein n=1 Tax=Pseudomonas sp. FP2196 TaxID=2954086 RepID=UPI0027359B0C|nr:hypothetical protein [Pseudomonas sp. FP2196]WLH35474.1 hypothetical protein PSH79_26810 [Pseudomonas sp. FP2196]